jgi:hypothetical protein
MRTQVGSGPIVPSPDKRGIGGMRIGSGNRSILREPVPLPSYSLTISRDEIWNWVHANDIICSIDA